MRTLSKSLQKVKLQMASLTLVPLDDTVVFPTMDVTLPVDVGDEDHVLLIPRHDGEFAKVGTVAAVTDRVRLPGGARAVQLSGVARGIAGAAHIVANPMLNGEVIRLDGALRMPPG